MGYGYAKQQLFECILRNFAKERQLYNHLHQNTEEVHIALAKGAEKARKIAREVLLRVRDKIGY
jgi:tryptophanyl-tRNA synthetase